MYFVHPQIKLNNLGKTFLSLIQSPSREKLLQKLSLYFPEKQFIFTDMGRSAFKIIIEKLNLQNFEILMPAYICDIFHPILKSYNIKPVFLDIDLKTFNIKIEEIKEKITPQTKAILICHTYGLPLDVKKIEDMLRSDLPGRLDLRIIEDCAHSFGANTGNLGNIAFFSLYKQFPALRGGLLICPQDWQVPLTKTSFDFRDFISLLNCFPFFAFFFKRFGAKFAPKMVRKEKLSKPAEINRASLNLFSNFLENFEKSLEKRKQLALFFQKELQKLGFEVQESENNAFCYLSALIPKNLRNKRDELVKNLRKHRVFCTRIWHTPIILNLEAQKEYQINLKEFSNTIEVAERIINFPLQNYYTQKDIKKMMVSIEKVIANL